MSVRFPVAADQRGVLSKNVLLVFFLGHAIPSKNKGPFVLGRCPRIRDQRIEAPGGEEVSSSKSTMPKEYTWPATFVLGAKQAAVFRFCGGSLRVFFFFSPSLGGRCVFGGPFLGVGAFSRPFLGGELGKVYFDNPTRLFYFHCLLVPGNEGMTLVNHLFALLDRTISVDDTPNCARLASSENPSAERKPKLLEPTKHGPKCRSKKAWGSEFCPASMCLAPAGLCFLPCALADGAWSLPNWEPVETQSRRNPS